jgi:3-deoxy-D-arabino-heptulosonate 7-phosphate (DAHP) synthase
MDKSIFLTSLTNDTDGLINEVHPDPVKAYSEGPQSLNLAKFPTLFKILVSLPN